MDDDSYDSALNNKLKPNISYLVICSAYNPSTSSGAFTLTVE